MTTTARQQLEWRINVPGGTSELLVPEPNSRQLVHRMWCLIGGLIQKLRAFLEKAWKLGVSEPRKLIHCLKVGMALTLVSLFYYMRPLYEGVGGNAMWAIMTVVVVFEFTVGATLSKSINRATATFLAGLLGVGVHWVADQSGDKLEPVIVGSSVFLLASAVTFSRFIPSIKARFDYGALIFILTFSLVSVSGYRVDELFELAHQRLTTVGIGTSLCILTSILVSPVWAGQELHNLIHRNLEKLASSVEGSVAVYFEDDRDKNAEDQKKMQAYKCVLNSKATEESMANFARWEPAHGRFSFRHPWKQYLKVGALMRNCAYCVETLTSCISSSEVQAPDSLKGHLSTACTAVSSHSSNVLKEVAVMMKSMTRSSKLDYCVGEMNFAVQELQEALTSFPSSHVPLIGADSEEEKSGAKAASASANAVPLLEVLPLVTLVSLLIEISTRIEDIVDAAVELAEVAEFKPPSQDKPKPKPKQNEYDTESQTKISMDQETKKP